MPVDHKTPRVVWNYAGDIQLAGYAAGPTPVVLLQAPATGLSKLTPELARELAWSLMSAADVAETLAVRSKGSTLVGTE